MSFKVVWAQNLQTSQIVDNGSPTIAIQFSSGGCSYQWTNDNPQIGLGANGLGDIPSFTAVNTGTKPIVAHIVAHSTSDGFAYIANSGSDNVTVINTSTHAFVADISVGNQPWGVSVSNDGRRVYVVNSNNSSGRAPAGSVSVIDATSNKVISTFSVGSNAVSVVANPNGKWAYVTNESSNSISVIDVVNDVVMSSIVGIITPTGIAINSNGTRLYVTAESNTATSILYVIDTSNNQVIQTVQISLRPTGIAVSPDGSKIYITNGNRSSISVVDAATYTVNTVAVNFSPYALAVSPAGDKVYVTHPSSNQISIVNTADNSFHTIILPCSPNGISVSPNGKEVYVACQNPDNVYVIDTQTETILPPIATTGSSAISIGNFVSAGIGCSTVPISFDITVNPSPNINDPGTVAASSAHYGASSTSQVINVSGNGLKAGITVTAPPGFEVSKDDITFTSTLLVGAAGDTTATQVFVRLKGNVDVAIYNGNIQLTSPGATAINVPVEGTVLTTQLNITADNKTKFLGDPIPVLTASYTGFVNGDTPAKLSTLPQITTTAVASSPIGKYPITVSGAIDKNYIIVYLPGVLEVVTGDISTPNAFTPNGDGINDTWDIKNLNLYTSCTVEVLNRYGQKVFYTTGYPKPWNGTENGGDLPVGTYYYIIKLKPDSRPLTGYLSIIR
ncbi:gliding motility-associated C-terminal domain-containing protein [Mucilaginibacter sp. dw_454]|uniref:T9SS type B sorting domain-containing protein n=1 Tax=Mucilaginibacter sp. dw_454 TaxID=2720079 RepID=UPI001BD231BF|nr:gliding motility-associated C-terminal domain-containing protein [Mucilaginibacter sp. dw_454]